MRKLLMLGLSAALAVPLSLPAQAAYPERPIRLIVPFAAGGGTDLLSRIVGRALSDRIGQPVTVENRPGAGGAIGADAAAKAAPDGYTLMIGTPGSMAINPVLQPNMPYDPLRDFAPIIQVATAPMVLAVKKDSPINSVKDLIALAKQKPGTINFASSGQASISHLSQELLKSMAGIDITHVPYKGTGQVATDLISGQVQMAMGDLPPMMAYVTNQQIKLIGVGSTKRSSLVPEVPSIAESGLPGYEATTWYGIFAPAGTPKEIIAAVNKAIADGMQAPAIQKQLATMGSQPVLGSPQELEAYLKSKLEEYRKLVAVAGIKAE